MEPEFWHSRWQAGQIGFHEGRVNRMLAAHVGALDLDAGARLFLPLCGKAVDIHWLRHEGYRVAGIELSEIAVRELFDEMCVTPEISQAGPLKRYAAEGLDIFVGDVFALPAETLGPVAAVYDRAALVALPEGVRTTYATHVATITGTAPQLLITFEYDQTQMDGPPFSLSEVSVKECYCGHYNVSVLSRHDVEGGLKGICPALEKTLLLTPA